MIRVIFIALYIIMIPSESYSKGQNKYIFSGSTVTKNNISFWLPCNYKYIGLSIYDTENGISLSPLLQVSNTGCSSFGRQMNIKMPFNTKRKIHTRKLNSRAHKLYYNRISYFHHNNLSKISTVQFDSNCRVKNPSLLVKTDLKGDVSAGVLSFLSNKTQKKRCKSHSRSLVIKDLDFKSSVKTLNHRSYQDNDFYSLRIKSIQKISPNSLTYKRRCNEAPVGIISKKTGADSFSLGILVASFPNLDCFNEKLLTEDKYALQSLKLDKNYNYKSIASKNLNDKWRINDIESYNFKSKLSLTYSTACEKNALSFVRDEKSSIQVGHLSLSSSCPNNPKQTKQDLPLLKRGSKVTVNSLRLKR